MTVLDIVKYGGEVLHRRTEPVTQWDGALAQIVRDMEETMHAARGIGLAANQVGIPLRLAIIDLAPKQPESKLWILVNPEIVEKDGLVRDDEGCLSIPEYSAPTDRPERVVARFQDLEGRTQEVEGTGLMARALCHEIDHLDGFVFVDRIRGMRGDLARSRVKKMARSGEWDDVHP
jgi:peptide deformylase